MSDLIEKQRVRQLEKQRELLVEKFENEIAAFYKERGYETSIYHEKNEKDDNVFYRFFFTIKKKGWFRIPRAKEFIIAFQKDEYTYPHYVDLLNIFWRYHALNIGILIGRVFS